MSCHATDSVETRFYLITLVRCRLLLFFGALYLFVETTTKTPTVRAQNDQQRQLVRRCRVQTQRLSAIYKSH